MKKGFAAMAAAALTAALMLCAPCAAAEDIKVIVNGSEVDFTGDQAPIIQDGRTLVPFRAVFEKMGATVTWDSDEKYCEAEYNGLTVGMFIDSVGVDVNLDVSLISDVPAQIINGRTMVPLRVISEGLGAKVEWDANTKTASVTTPDPSENAPQAIEYEMVDKSINNDKLTVNYKQFNITSSYPTASRLAENLNKDLEQYASDLLNGYEGDKTTIDVYADMIFNYAGIILVGYDEADVTEPTHYVGYRINSGESIDPASLEGACYAAYTDDEVKSAAGDGYTVNEYVVSCNTLENKTFIAGIIQYPVFEGRNEANDAIADKAMTIAEDFCDKYFPQAYDIYFTYDLDMAEVPYKYSCVIDSIAVDGDTATVSCAIHTNLYSESESTTEEKIFTINLATGEVEE